MVLDYARAAAVFPYDENSVSAGSKSGERVYGSRYYIALLAQQLEQLLKAVARIAFCQLSQRMDHRFITPGIGLIKIHRPAQR